MSEIDKAKAFYQAHLKSRYGTPRGCSTEEVDAVEKQVGHPLPAAYRVFLLWMGKDKDGVFRGSDWSASDVAENTEYVGDLLQENGLDWQPEGPILSFFCHQGYMIAWFDLPAAEDDPLCYFFSEGDEMTVPKQEETFSEFLLKELEGMAAARPG